MNNRLGSIELLRIFFTFTIISGHLLDNGVRQFFINDYNFPQNFLLNYSYVVEFFFIISGFFLYQNISKNNFVILNYITNLYLKLSVPIIITYMLACIFLDHKFNNIFGVLFLINGLSLPGEFLIAGSWFCGVLLWCSILYVNILYTNKKNILIVLVIVYCSICLALHAELTSPINGEQNIANINGTYKGIIGGGVIRGLAGIGLGILTAFLGTHLNFTQNKFNYSVFSLIEIFISYKIFHWIYFSRTHIIIMMLAFSLLLIFLSNSAGIISKFLNTQNRIFKASKYVYEIFIAHSFCLLYLGKKIIHKPLMFYFSVLVSSIILGIVMHYLIKILSPKLSNIFKK